MKTDCIPDPPCRYYIKIHADHIRICGGNTCAAMLISAFRWATNGVLINATYRPDDLPWVRLSIPRLMADICGLAKRTKVISSLAELVDMGFLEKRCENGKTAEYRLCAAAIQNAFNQFAGRTGTETNRFANGRVQAVNDLVDEDYTILSLNNNNNIREDGRDEKNDHEDVEGLKLEMDGYSWTEDYRRHGGLGKARARLKLNNDQKDHVNRVLHRDLPDATDRRRFVAAAIDECRETGNDARKAAYEAVKVLDNDPDRPKASTASRQGGEQAGGGRGSGGGGGPHRRWDGKSKRQKFNEEYEKAMKELVRKYDGKEDSK